jgi:hypothetical protein
LCWGGSGNGEQIAANKVIGTRAVLAYDADTARLGREHNDANVISIGARMHTEEEALEIVRLFLARPLVAILATRAASDCSPTTKKIVDCSCFLSGVVSQHRRQKDPRLSIQTRRFTAQTSKAPARVIKPADGRRLGQ